MAHPPFSLLVCEGLLMAKCRRLFPAIFPVFLMLAGCGAPDGAAGVGGVTAGEAEALNEAAAMLDERAGNARAALAAEESSGP